MKILPPQPKIKIPVSLPKPLSELAKADVMEMRSTLNPEHPSVEAVLANHDVRLAIIEKTVGWILVTTVSTLLAATGSLLLIVLHK